MMSTYTNPGLTKCDSVENQMLAEARSLKAILQFIYWKGMVYKILNILMKINPLYYAGLSGSRLPEDY